MLLLIYLQCNVQYKIIGVWDKRTQCVHKIRIKHCILSLNLLKSHTVLAGYQLYELKCFCLTLTFRHFFNSLFLYVSHWRSTWLLLGQELLRSRRQRRERWHISIRLSSQLSWSIPWPCYEWWTILAIVRNLALFKFHGYYFTLVSMWLRQLNWYA